jgi:hypothetical protein
VLSHEVTPARPARSGPDRCEGSAGARRRRTTSGPAPGRPSQREHVQVLERAGVGGDLRGAERHATGPLALALPAVPAAAVEPVLHQRPGGAHGEDVQPARGPAGDARDEGGARARGQRLRARQVEPDCHQCSNARCSRRGRPRRCARTPRTPPPAS